MRRVNVLLCLFAVVLCSATADVARGTIIYSDAVESGADWTTGATTAVFWDSVGADPYFTQSGPSEGVQTGLESGLLSGHNGFIDASGLSSSGLTVQAGTYIVSGLVGNPNNVGFPATTRFNLYPGGFAGGDYELFESATYLVSSVTPTPGLGLWETWTKTYEIPSGDANLGRALSFIVQNLHGGRNMTFDGVFTINAVPEPSTLLIWSLGLLGLAWYGRRRRK